MKALYVIINQPSLAPVKLTQEHIDIAIKNFSVMDRELKIIIIDNKENHLLQHVTYYVDENFKHSTTSEGMSIASLRDSSLPRIILDYGKIKKRGNEIHIKSPSLSQSVDLHLEIFACVYFI